MVAAFAVFYILVIIFGILAISMKLTADNSFILLLMWVIVKLGGAYVMLFAGIQLAKMFGLI